MPSINLCGKGVFEDDGEEKRIGFRMVYMPSDMLIKISMSGLSHRMMKVVMYIVGMTYGNDSYITVRSISEALLISYISASNRVSALTNLGIVKRCYEHRANVGINEDVRQWKMPKGKPKVLCVHRKTYGRKFSKEDVRCIREMLADGMEQEAIAKHFDANRNTISAIKTGRIWRWLQ